MKTKSDWEKEFKRIMGFGDGVLRTRMLEDFIRQTREQARQEGIEEAIEKIKGMKKKAEPNPIQDFNLPHGNDSDYNQAIEDVLAELKKKGKE